MFVYNTRNYLLTTGEDGLYENNLLDIGEFFQY